MSPRHTVSISLTRLTLISAAAIALQGSAAHATVLVGSNYAGADLAPADGDYLQGTFTNVGTFTVPAGVTVLVDPGNTLSITANAVDVDGTIDGVGAGYGGGLGGVDDAGVAGAGPGGGGGGPVGFYENEPSAGGGGGYGGAGGAGGHRISAAGAGGNTYGTDVPPTFEQGSGGGGAAGMPDVYGGIGGDGGSGGAAIRILAVTASFGPTSLVTVDGQEGRTGVADPNSGSASGGGGAGGSIYLDADSLTVEGTLSADGGRGADKLPGALSPDMAAAAGGGGGGGGRIKLVGASSLCDSSTKSVAGGDPGASDNAVYEGAFAGSAGTTSSTGTTCCGNGVLEGGELCDDGSADAGDCCSEVCEPRNSGNACTSDGSPCTADFCNAGGVCAHDAAPIVSGCLAAPASKIGLKETFDEKRKLSWSWSKGAAFDQSDLGDPLVDATYTLCLYDYNAGVPSVKVDTEVLPSATLWTDKDPKGLQFKDKSAGLEGVTKMSLKTGLAGKTQVKFSASGDNLVLPFPVAPLAYFQQDPKVTVQLFNNAGTCWTADYIVGDTKKTDNKNFKAQVKE